ncbi:MAG: glycosyltransferase family 4 protein [bacterium]
MNILHLHWGFPPIIGGVETHLATMLPVMVQYKHKVSLITGSVEGTKGSYLYKGAKIYRTPIMDLNWLFKRGFEGLEPEIKAIFEKVIDREKPDIVNAHNMHYFSKMHITLLRSITKKKGIPLVLSAHNVWDDMLFLDLIGNIDWDHIIAVSHFIKRELFAVSCPDKKVTVIHHGVDMKKYNPHVSTKSTLKKYPILKNRRIIFHPARMGLAKGCDISIKAINLIKNKYKDILLVLAGTKNIIDWGATQQKDIAYMIGLSKAMNLENNLLIDAFNMDEVASLYVLSSVCLYPSSAPEPFGLTMLEALSTGRPMIVTNSGGMPEIIQEGINGYVIPIKDTETLAMRIIQLLDNDSLRQRLGDTGLQIVKSHYTKEIMTSNYIKVYNKILH